MPQPFFHAVFVCTFIAFTAIRAYYMRKAMRQAGPAEYREGGRHILWRQIIGIPWIVGLFAYMFRPDWLAWADFPLPEWAQWLGVVFSLASLALIAWVQWALDVNFSTVLHVRERHTLVTHGPYRWVRHPMYSVLFLFVLGALLLTHNAWVGLIPLVALTLIVVTRLKNEEAAMLEKFGEEYRAYMGRTGRFWPKIV